MSKEKKNLVSEKIVLLNKKEVAEIFGYCMETVNQMFNDDGFPAIKYGKTHLVEIDALKNYISTRRG